MPKSDINCTFACLKFSFSLPRLLLLKYGSLLLTHRFSQLVSSLAHCLIKLNPKAKLAKGSKPHFQVSMVGSLLLFSLMCK